MDMYDSLAHPNCIDLKLRIGSTLFTVSLNRGFFEPSESYTVENHNHFDYEFHFVVSGSASVEINGERAAIHPNSYYIIGPGIYHELNAGEFRHIQRYSFRMTYCKLSAADEYFPTEEDRKIREILQSIKFRLFEDAGSNLQIMCEIRRELQDRRLGYCTKIQTLFSQLIINTIRDASQDTPTGYIIPGRLYDDKRALMIEDFFEHSYDINTTAGKLAGELHVSVRQLSRIFQDTFNMSFKQKLLEKRMEMSKNFLKYTDLPIKSISEKVGYDTESNFSAMFRRKNGCTPVEYRTKNSAAVNGES